MELPNLNDKTFATPTGSADQFDKVLKDIFMLFRKNAVCRRIEDGSFKMADYHRLLGMLFHQVFHSSNTFALAAVNMESSRFRLRDYLLKHAEEERTHWTWILNDLENTRYRGPHPMEQFPAEPAQAYISFNYYIAMTKPFARLGIAAMLEGLAANLAKEYMAKFSALLKLTPNQAVFFLGHGETDTAHARELAEVIGQAKLSPSEWGWMCYAADTAAKLYQRMYDEAAREQ